MTFSDLGFCEAIQQALIEQGYQTPTPVQAQAIPVVMAGKDLIAVAQTGTGKTASYVLPLLEQLKDNGIDRAKRVQALILVPTRELAEQVLRSIEAYGQNISLTSLAVYGGVDAEAQKQSLLDGVDLLVATPGRLIDLMYQKAVRFDALQTLVLDEADRMLDMGFIQDINKIVERLPEQRQSLLFSATMSEQVRRLAKSTIYHAVEITVANDAAVKPKINQWLITVDKDQKSALLSHLIQENDWQQGLIFIRTKHGAAKLVSQLEKRGIQAEAIHGDRSQAMRTKILDQFKVGDIPFLVATGIAARGIDIDDLTRVINYDLPDEPDDYVHRIGRTGRAGASGEALSLVSKDDFRRLCDIESRIGHIIERRDLEAFTPRKPVPISILNYVPKSGSSKLKAPNNHSKRRSSAKSADKKRTNTPKPGKASARDRTSEGHGKSGARGVSPWSNWEKKKK